MDVWSVGIILLEFITSLTIGDDSYDLISSLSLREISYESRVQVVRQKVEDVAF